MPRPGQPCDERPRSMRALVVDDEEAIRGLLARLLERQGFEVCEAHSGEAALAMAESAAVSLVLCDVRMPGMSGSHLYRELTIRDPKMARSFVFITGDRSRVHVEETCAACRCSRSHLPRPISTPFSRRSAFRRPLRNGQHFFFAAAMSSFKRGFTRNPAFSAAFTSASASGNAAGDEVDDGEIAVRLAECRVHVDCRLVFLFCIRRDR